MIYLGSNEIETIKVGSEDCSIYLGETKVYPEGAHDYSQDYFTTVALGSGNISFSGSSTANTFSYSTNEGQTWSTPAQVNTVAVSNGDKVMWKGEATPDTNGIGKFTTATTANFNVEGNAMSLLYGDNFVGQTDLSGKSNAFDRLFNGITHVVSAENLVLPANTLASHCYYYMFGGCTSLTTAPQLPATTLAYECYYNMFQGCTNLMAAPQLPATTLDYECYYRMFSGCTSLTTAPELPATTLASECYRGMFQGCTSLTRAPQLPATTLNYGCYRQMFQRCSNLQTAPELPATRLIDNCYNYMFQGCTSLNSITCLATDISAMDCTKNWVSGVSASGTFYKAASMNDWQIDSVNGIPVGWTVKNYGEKDYSEQYFTTVALSNGTIRFKGSNSSNKLSYSTDSGSTWTEMTSQTVSVPVNEGDSVMWKGETMPIANGGIGTFTSAATASFDVEGNAMSLLFGDNFQGQTDLSGNGYSLERLFSGNTHLASAENLSLPATTLSSGCYKEMFSGCTNLTTAPQLPAMTLTEICYSNMFDSCTSLAIAPELPATTLGRNCYQAMFQGCTSLTTAPTVLPATTLAIGCYGNMFQGCTNLTTAPSVLSATALTNSCYSRMFQGCTNLSTAPQLPATTLADYCYEGMFMSCGSLTTAPALHATTLANYSYNNMFYRCSNISSIACLATDISATDCTKDWLDGVASTGTFTKAASMTGWTTGVDGIPQNWTVVDA